MKIFHFIPIWSLGGAERVITELINNYPADIQATILTLQIKGREDNYENVLVLKSGRLRKYLSFIIFVLQNKPDILHAHMTPTIPFLLILRIIRWRIKIVYTVHGEYRKPNNWFLKILDYLFYKKCNISIVSVSEFTYRSIRKNWDIPHLVIYNGINVGNPTFSKAVLNEINLVKKTESTKIFLSVSRIVPVKNLELLVRSFNEISDKHDAILIVIGYDPTSDQKELKRLKHIACGNVFFIGVRTNINDYLKYADALCMSSSSEAFPIALLEAFSQAVPVISTKVGGIPEAVIHGENGFLCPDASLSGYVKTINDFLTLSFEEVAVLKENALQRFKKLYTSENMFLNYLKIYKGNA